MFGSCIILAYLLCETDRPSAYAAIAIGSPWVVPSSDFSSKSLATDNLGAILYVFFLHKLLGLGIGHSCYASWLVYLGC